MRIVRRIARSIPSVLPALLLSLPAGAVAQQGLTTTAGIFREHAGRVVKIEVVETGSAAKASIGSGFFVSARGDVVTNYHVVSDLVHAPGRYRADLVDASGARHKVAVLAVDVVHDLAVLTSDISPPAHFTLEGANVSQGQRLYSLGHPRDLGLSIVEGTYNGHLSHTLHPRIHFTGSLNPGMSGGPAITDEGRVVGINVASSGEQLSFLVPVERAASLLERARSHGRSAVVPTMEQVGEQLRQYQNVYLRDMFAGVTEMVNLGPFRVVTQPAPFFRCWADATRSDELPYEEVQHRCSTDDYLFVAGEHSSGVVEVEHTLLSTRKLGATRFFSLYSSIFGRDDTPSGSEEHVTAWQCSTRNVRNAHLPMRAVLCLRRYRKLGELYDAVLKVAVLGRKDQGLISTLTLSGVTFENVELLSRRYLQHVTWR